MALDYARMKALPPIRVEQTYDQRDAILYALGVGSGIEPELDRVYEDGLVALPTLAVVLATPGFWLKEPQHGVDWAKVLHGEQGLQLHRPVPVSGQVRSETTVEEIYDKGEGKGAVILSSRKLYDMADGGLIATQRVTSFARGDGGCGGSTASAPPPATVPEGEPDEVVDLTTRPEQALIYRLSGDYNPLHADPEVARGAGFPGPILHGLCTYGVAGRALGRAAKARGLGALTRFDVRFSSPVFPGETIRTEIWWVGEKEARFRARVVERDVVVLNNGLAEF